MTSTGQATHDPPSGVQVPQSGSPPLARWLESPRATVGLLVGASLALRLLAWAILGTGTIESEGAEYARIAENLKDGVGYVGLVSRGPQVLFPPLLPLLIAGVSYLTGSVEIAGRLVSLICGALLPLPVFGIAARIFNRRVGFIAAALSILHPILVYLAFMVYSEGPYATLFVASMYLGLRVIQDGTTKWWLLMAAGFALGYLTRAEGFVAFVISVGVCLLLTREKWTHRLKQAALAVAVFAAFALPEVLYLKDVTGRLSLEAKSSVLFSYTGGRVVAAESRPDAEWSAPSGLRDFPTAEHDVAGGYPEKWQEKWAVYGVNSDVQEVGFSVRSNSDIARSEKVAFQHTLPLMLKGMKLNVPTLIQRLTATWMGPLLPALAFLGLFRHPWRGARTRSRVYVSAMMLTPVIATFFVLWNDARYYFIFVPLLVIWAANGVDMLAGWVRSTGIAAGGSFLTRPLYAQAIPALVVAFLVLSPLKAGVYLYQFHDSAPVRGIERELGVWLGKQQNHPVRIMDLRLPMVFHAGANHRFFPYCDADTALRYLDAAEVDYVVLRRGTSFTKYYSAWAAHGIPNERAKRVQLPNIPGIDEFVVYRWLRDDRRAAMHRPN